MYSYWQFLFFYILAMHIIENETGFDARIIIVAIANRKWRNDHLWTPIRENDCARLRIGNYCTSARSLEVPNSINRPSLRAFAKVLRQTWSVKDGNDRAKCIYNRQRSICINSQQRFATNTFLQYFFIYYILYAQNITIAWFHKYICIYIAFAQKEDDI